METNVKPLLKWIGGKTQIINQIINLFPIKIKNYHEPFIGGASVLLKLLEKQKEGSIIITNKIYAYDLNNELIEFYKIIQNEPIKFYKVIKKIIKKFNLTDNKEQFYYSMRGLYNNIKINNIKKSALFLFLNKTGFRGLFRESKKGFNVPYGNYNNPEIINYDNLLNFSNLIKNVIFINYSFENSLIKINKLDFVYLDPPYYPENKISFTNYTNEGFDLETHTKLFNICLKMKNKFIISNSDTEFVKQFFKNYKINKIKVKRRINPDNPNSFTNELIIKNY